ncbi:PAS domain S-box protein [Methanofollis fontis]|uniref:histidine kinase n=1 Tax=Methanofollis fontis TaxID=2052832 RepID=A0A483CRN9_9EURY|nr:PAS domain S-box protein [Methanofollis fontis]TAJ44861.1 hypothetical protein CUJ86_06130 [Methanofollis fontis]
MPDTPPIHPLNAVLCVDDDPAFTDLTRRFLEQLGDCRVDTAASAEEALDKLQNGSFAAIVSDYQMPGMNGIDLLRTVRGSGSQIPFILFTGMDGTEIIAEAMYCGADSFLQKNGGSLKEKISSLSDSIREAIERRDNGEDSEDLYWQIFNNSSDSIFVHRFSPEGTHGALVEVNNTACQRLGYSRNELRSMGISQILQSLDHLPAVRKDLQESGYSTYESVHITKDGHAFPNDINAHLCTLNNETVVISTARDITEQKEVEERLKRYEQNLQTIIDSANFGIVIIGSDGFIKRINRSALRMAGYERPEEVVGSICHKTLWPDELGRHPPLDPGQVVDHSEHILFTKNGEEIPITQSVSPITLNDETVYLVQFIDRSDMVAAEMALREIEQAYRNALENATDLIQSVSPDGRFLFVNRSWLDTLGYTEDEVADLTLSDIIAPESLDHCMKTFQNIMQGGPISTVEAAFCAKDGRKILVEGSVNCILENGHPVITRGFFRDVTERKRAEQKIRHLNHVLHAIRDVTAITAREKDPYNLIRESCETLVQRRGYTMAGIALLEGVISDGPTIVTSGCSGESIHMLGGFLEGEMTPCIKTAMEEGGVIVIDEGAEPCAGCPHLGQSLPYGSLITKLTHEGNLFGIMIASMPPEFVSEPEEQELFSEVARDLAFALYSLDLEGRTQYHDALLEANKKLNILSGITRHDILNQVTALSGYLEILTFRLPGDPEVLKLIDRLKVLTSTIQRQISFTKDYQDMGVNDPLWQDVRSVVERAASGTHRLNGIDIDVDIGPLEILADAMLEKVFFNLIDNAIRHGGEVTEIRVRFHEKGERGVLVIEDNGSGIHPEMKARLFLRGSGKNTGYGLFLSREILGITGMIIEETGEEGNGARFEIEIPPGVYRRPSIIPPQNHQTSCSRESMRSGSLHRSEG